MTDIELLNDPDYRWNHKEEMSKMMPFHSIRNELGLVVIDYEKLRSDNNSNIKKKVVHKLDWDILRGLTRSVAHDSDKCRTKTGLQPADRYHFEKRDQGVCCVCGTVSKYGYEGDSHLHHVIPNGDVSERNIVTLCKNCHQMVHLALYASGEWKYAMVS